MAIPLEPGDRIRLNGRTAEVIRLHAVGELSYLRAYVEGEGVKSVCVDHVAIDRLVPDGDSPYDTLPHDVDLSEAFSPDRFDLRTQAVRLRLAHRRGQLLSISSSLVRLEPYQLACVNEVMQRLRQRVLIADDVGLGKTVEAGLILKELEARRRADRVLLVVPSHLKKKWVREMERYFDLRLTVGDREWVESERRRLGEEANVWGQEGLRLITSMAFIRQDEFAQPLEEAFWDVVVVDECHKASKKGSAPSRTARRVEQVAQQSDALLLLSATPHTGKEESFRSLISYVDPFRVARDQELTRAVVDEVMIRRGKETIFDDAGNRIFTERKVQTVSVEMTPSEERFYEAVTHYVRTVYNRSELLSEPAVGLAMALMQKRLVSSVGAIRATLRRRLQGLLEGRSSSLSAEARSYLAGEDLEEADQADAEHELERVAIPGGDDALQAEVEALQQLVAMAERIAVDSKPRKVQSYIQSLLEEDPTEKLLLFTEYRDTLDYFLELCDGQPWYDEILVIHGDVDKDERTRIEDEFNYGRSRLLFATDAASEGIDLQKRCHIMINYELPWNPNRLEQRIGRIHRYGQQREVKVLNFQLSGTREGEIFELLEQKIENIRERLGATADVLGFLEDLDIESLILRSIRDDQPRSATQEELERELARRQQTLQDWYERSLIDCSTFDADSRARIQEVIGESLNAFGSSSDIRSFVVKGVEVLGGAVEVVTPSIVRITPPPSLAAEVGHDVEGRLLTFDRAFAMEREEVHFVAPDAPLVTALIHHVLHLDSGIAGTEGIKVLPFIHEPGITYNFRIALEDGSGEVLREELLPVFVGSSAGTPRSDLGRRVLEGEPLTMEVHRSSIEALQAESVRLRRVAETFVSRSLQRMHQLLLDERMGQIDRELHSLEQYAASERQRLNEFIRLYEERQAAGEDMTIAIRGQRRRLDHLMERLGRRRQSLNEKARVIALEPELVNLCFTLPG